MAKAFSSSELRMDRNHSVAAHILDRGINSATWAVSLQRKVGAPVAGAGADDTDVELL
jgi:hypothetical protein